MHLKGFLHNWLSVVMHKKRLVTLTLLVLTLLETKRLSLTALGRAMPLPIQERSGIRRADRFLGNEKLQTERKEICKAHIQKLLGNKKRPVFLIDWTSVPNTRHHVLRAAWAAKGRAITLYEEVHPEEELENNKVHKEFLKRLKKILPDGCQPILVTDAGFYNAWFKQVLRLGWDYVGRVRGTHKYYDGKAKRWIECKKILRKATERICCLGEVKLCKTNVLVTFLYWVKERSKGRKCLNKRGHEKQGTNERKYRQSANEPWLLASSLKGNNYLRSQRVRKLYQKRMQIEEGFRDLKSSRYGFGLEHAYSQDKNRIELLLLIAMLACFLAWIVGWIGEKNKWHYQFQSSSIKTKRELSLFFLGCQIMKRKIPITVAMFKLALPRCLESL